MGKTVGFCPELHSTPSPSIPLSPERKRDRPSVAAVVVRRSVSSKGCCRLTQLRGTSRNTRNSRRRGRGKRMDGRQDESPCTRNARPPKGLARRSQRYRHGFHSMRGEVSELGRIVAKRRAGNFLLTGLGTIRNRACRSPSAEKPIEWTSQSFGMPWPGKN